jgi:hypothetical protein
MNFEEQYKELQKMILEQELLETNKEKPGG